MRWIANFIYLMAGLCYLPVALYHAVVFGKNRRGWAQRFGFVPEFPTSRVRVWIHAVSLGEVNATTRVVQELSDRMEFVDIVVSTTTDTGYARAVELYGNERVFRFPLDFSPVIARALRRIKPTLIVLVELEVWYNLTTMATAKRIPVVVINGRLTKRSARRLGFLIGVRRMFRALAWVGAQDEPIAQRFRRLGVAADRIEVTSSLKWDSAHVSDEVDGSRSLAFALGIDRTRPLWVCGSTGPAEEAVILDAYRRLLDDPTGMAQGLQDDRANDRGACAFQLAVIPRKPERFDEVARLIEQSGFACVRRSMHTDDYPTRRVSADTVILGDTMGELRKFYALADVAFVGRSLVPMGGSDPMEVAALAKPVLVGPHMDNFAMPVAALAEAGALDVVTDADSLAEAVARTCADPCSARERGLAGRATVLAHQGATRRTVDRLVSFLAESPGSREYVGAGGHRRVS